MAETELAPDYYLDNFFTLIHHAQNHYPDLLSEQERDWLQNFAGLPHASQCLLVRMLSRKGHWFRSDKLNYAEIGPVDVALVALETANMVAINPPISAAELGEYLLTKPELIALYPTLDKRLPKPLLLANLDSQNNAPLCKLEFSVIELYQPKTIDVLLLLFFANTHQDLSQFVLSDLGLHQFETYPLSKARRFFQTRAQVDQRLQLSELNQRYQNAPKLREVLVDIAAQIPTSIDHSYVDRKREQLLNHISRDLERLGEYQAALHGFNQTTLPPSRERRARIHDKLEQFAAMQLIVDDMQSHPVDISEHEVASKLAARLKRRLGEKVPRSSKTKPNQQQLSLDLSELRVEIACLNHFTQQGFETFYCENVLLNGLFGLLFWEVIFAPVDGAFINAYQSRPLDLYHPDFTLKRQNLIDQTLSQALTLPVDFWLERYKDKYSISNPFVHWQALPEMLVSQALNHIPRPILVELFKVLLSDLKLFRSGMPDLILFKDGNFEWVEVKGPGDKLQDSQLRWISHFERLKVPFSVCYVNQS